MLRTAERGDASISSVCLSVCPPARPSVMFIKYRDHIGCDRNMGDLVQREHSLPTLGWNRVGGQEHKKKPAISPKRCKVGPRLL